jgi:hypothetical protein
MTAVEADDMNAWVTDCRGGAIRFVRVHSVEAARADSAMTRLRQKKASTGLASGSEW